MREQDLTPRDDVLSFVTEPLYTDIEITGPVQAVLYVQTTAPNTDFAVTIMDVHTDGRAYNISEGILRASYDPGAGGGRDDVARIEISMWPTSIVIGKGHSLRVHISSSSYPRFDVNPNTGRPTATETAPVIANQTLLLGGATPSHIVLPVIPR
jgi:putative CocE/NonD family hydrolase